MDDYSAKYGNNRFWMILIHPHLFFPLSQTFEKAAFEFSNATDLWMVPNIMHPPGICWNMWRFPFCHGSSSRSSPCHGSSYSLTPIETYGDDWRSTTSKKNTRLTVCVHNQWIPIGSMYGIYANIWGTLMVNVTIYGIHGSYGIWKIHENPWHMDVPRISNCISVMKFLEYALGNGATPQQESRKKHCHPGSHPGSHLVVKHISPVWPCLPPRHHCDHLCISQIRFSLLGCVKIV